MSEILFKTIEMPYNQDKKLIVESLFHQKLWSKLDFNDKKTLLQLLENILSIQENSSQPAKITCILKRPHLATTRNSKEIIFSEYHLEKATGVEAFCAVIHEHVHTKQYENNRIVVSDLIPYKEDISGYTYYRLQPIEFEAFQKSEERTKKVFSELQERYGEDTDFKDWQALTDAAQPEKLVEYFNEYFGTTETLETLQYKMYEQNFQNDGRKAK